MDKLSRFHAITAVSAPWILLVCITVIGTTLYGTHRNLWTTVDVLYLIHLSAISIVVVVAGAALYVTALARSRREEDRASLRRWAKAGSKSITLIVRTMVPFTPALALGAILGYISAPEESGKLAKTLCFNYFNLLAVLSIAGALPPVLSLLSRKEH